MTLQCINHYASSLTNKVRVFFYRSKNNVDLIISIGEEIFEELHIKKKDKVNIFYDDEDIRHLFIKKVIPVEMRADKDSFIPKSYSVSHSGHTYKVQKRFYLFDPSPGS
jgi:hypothetical protein